MSFWNVDSLQLEEFRPGIKSKAEIGDSLIMVCMEINPGREEPDTNILLTSAESSCMVKLKCLSVMTEKLLIRMKPILFHLGRAMAGRPSVTRLDFWIYL